MVIICTIVWGIIMLITACAGFKGLKWLNYIAVPLLVIVCLYGIEGGYPQGGLFRLDRPSAKTDGSVNGGAFMRRSS